MPASDGIPSSPPGPGTSLEESLRYYKAQYEILEAELSEFQASSKDLEAELEKDIEAFEKRERQFKDQATNLRYEVDTWKEKHKQAKSEAGIAQATLEREIKQLRQENLSLRQRVRDIEVANDDYERQQRNTEVSLEDMESKYNQTIERSVLLEDEIRTGELERESLRIEAQRLKDEFSDFKVEADITRKKLEKAEGCFARGRRPLSVESTNLPHSPRSELSPTTTDTSAPSFDTPPAKTLSSSGVSDIPTPPSPPASEMLTPVPKTRMSINNNTTTTRPPLYPARTNGHVRGPSVAALNRTGPSSTYRQSLSRPSVVNMKSAGLPQSSSIMHLRTLRGKMQKLEERVHTARSKLPTPSDTPPKVSPRSTSALGQNVPASITMRSRKRTVGSTNGGSDDQQSTPSVSRTRGARQSINQQMASPTRDTMAAPPRPSSRASGISSRASTSQYVPGHSRPGSRASISGVRGALGTGLGTNFAPNASTEKVRPHSSLSSRGGYDGKLDEEAENKYHDLATTDIVTPTPRRTTFVKRTSDIGTAIPTPSSNKRTSLGGISRLPNSSRRQSAGMARPGSSNGDVRPASRQTKVLDGVEEVYDVNDTF